MITTLHFSRAFEKQKSILNKAGKKGAMAVRQCERILEIIKNNGCITTDITNKRTRNGECRIENCVKYSLGHGYRLVTVLSENQLFISFIGSHDDADQWISRHKNDVFSAEECSLITEELATSDHSAPARPADESEYAPDEPDYYEELLQARIDQSLLRQVFHGLCKQ